MAAELRRGATSMRAARSLCLALLLVILAPAGEAEIVVTGVEPDVAGAIRSGLTLTGGCEQPGWLVRYRFRTARDEAERVLHTYGFYAPSVDTRLTFTKDCWDVRIRVDRGKPTRVTEFDLQLEGEGARLPRFRELLDATPLRQGARFDHEIYETLKSDIDEVAARFGLLEGRFTEHEVLVNPDAASAVVHLHYDTGPRYRFGEIHFDSDAVEEKLLRRQLPFQQGQLYDAERLNDLYQALIASGFFEEVSVRPGAVDAERAEIPIDVYLVPGKTVTSKIGLGYSTDLGPSTFWRREQRLANRRGHQTNVDLSYSPARSVLGGYYRIPQQELNGWLTLYGGYELDDTDARRSSKTTVALRRIKPRGSHWIETRFFEILHSRFEVAGETDSNDAFVPGLNFAYTRTDRSVARPAQAHRIAFELSGTSRSIGSTVDFVSVTANGKVIQSLGKRLRFLGRARVGYTLTPDFDRLAPSFRFFSGGDDRVRGYDFEEIGALDAQGNSIGGDRLVELSGEIDCFVGKNWAIAAFLDGGNVSISSFADTLRRGAGIGFRWYSPIGPVRVDFAKPLNDGKSNFRIHISLGPDI